MMEEGEGEGEGEIEQQQKKAPPSLPPNYVSLAQLQEIWLQKQKEKNQAENQIKNEKIVEEETDKGSTGKGRKNKRYGKKNRDKCSFEGFDGEIGRKNGCKGVEISSPRKNESSGGGGGTTRGKSERIEETMVVSVLDDLPNEDGVKEAVPEVKSGGLNRGRVRRNGANRVTGGGIMEYRVKSPVGKSNEVEMSLEMKVDGKGNGEDSVERRRRRRGGNDRSAGNKKKEYSVKAHNLKANEVGMSMGNKVGDEKDNANNRENRRRNGDNRDDEYSLKESGVAVHGVKGKEVELQYMNDIVDPTERNGNDRSAGNKKKEYIFKLHNLKVNEVGTSIGKKVEDEKVNASNWKARRRNGDNRDDVYSLKESGVAVHGMKGKEVELNSECLAEDEILEVGSKMNDVDPIDRNGFLRQGNRVEREGVVDNTDRMALEKKANDEDSVVDRARNGEARNGFRKGNVRKKVWPAASGDLSASKSSSTVERTVGNYRRYGSSGRSNVRKTKLNDSGMIWVKKEERSSAMAAEVGS